MDMKTTQARVSRENHLKAWWIIEAWWQGTIADRCYEWGERPRRSATGAGEGRNSATFWP